MSTFLFKLGHLASRHPWRIIGAWLVLACATFFLNAQVGGEPNDDFRLPGAESQRAVDLLEDKFPAQNPYTSQIVFSDSRGGQPTGDPGGGHVGPGHGGRTAARRGGH